MKSSCCGKKTVIFTKECRECGNSCDVIVEITDIDYKVIADHFKDRYNSRKSCLNSFREMKKQDDSGIRSLWPIYVKSYYFDLNEEGK